MSLDKAIEHGREWRKPYRRNRRISSSCRNHGECKWCRGNYTYNLIRTREAQAEAVEDFKEGENYGRGR